MSFTTPAWQWLLQQRHTSCLYVCDYTSRSYV